MSENNRKQRLTWAPEEKAEMVLAGLRGDRGARNSPDKSFRDRF